MTTKNELFEWLVMPCGLKNAINTFSKVMNEIFRNELDSFVKVFVDDLNIHSLDSTEHLQHLLWVLQWLREVYLRLNPSKCKIGASDIVLLGHLVRAAGIWPYPSTVVAVQDFPAPTTPTNMKAFLGFTSYYRNFNRGYSCMAGPLFKLMCKDVSFV